MQEQLCPHPTYINDVQPIITCQMRAVLIDWLVEVADDFKLATETLYLAVAHIDRFLSVRQISNKELQLLGTTCLLIAAKYEEINPPSIERFAYVTDQACTVSEIVRVEAEVLHHLHFRVSVPTSKVSTPSVCSSQHGAQRLPHVQFASCSR